MPVDYFSRSNSIDYWCLWSLENSLFCLPLYQVHVCPTRGNQYHHIPSKKAKRQLTNLYVITDAPVWEPYKSVITLQDEQGSVSDYLHSDESFWLPLQFITASVTSPWQSNLAKHLKNTNWKRSSFSAIHICATTNHCCYIHGPCNKQNECMGSLAQLYLVVQCVCPACPYHFFFSASHAFFDNERQVTSIFKN